MQEHSALFEKFYTAFQNLDAETMASCYHEDISFSDPVFENLQGAQAPAMWRMLCSRAKDLKLEFSNITADERQGSAHWEARYTFSATGRQVHNKIDAYFTFRDGLLYNHRDDFDFWAWTRMALGAKGILLGWAPPVQNAVRKQAMKGLETFMAKNNT